MIRPGKRVGSGRTSSCVTTAGTFRVLPTYAEMMYAPEVSGRTDGGTFEVK